MLPGDRLICIFIKPLEQGAAFTVWPLHLTLIPWFRMHASTEELVKDLEKRFQRIQPFELVVGNEAHFGHKRSKLVNLIQSSKPLQQIERRLRVYLHLQGAWIVDEITKTKRPFRPHVTVQGNMRLQSGDTFVCDQLAVVRQEGAFKEVVGIVELGHA